MAELWFELIHRPYLLGLIIILSTYLLEDAAIITAALLSADGLISPFLAFYALTIGIFTGDLGLYAMGSFLEKRPSLKSWIGERKINIARDWLHRRKFLTLLAVRPIPGLRLPVYTACGFLKLPFHYFSFIILFASIIWTGLVFSSIFYLGNSFWSALSSWKWLLLVPLIGGLIYGGKTLNHLILRKVYNDPT